MRIEDYALVGDLRTTALIGRNGSLDWLCLPTTGSSACFARLLGTDEHGHWAVGPLAKPKSVRRRYRPGTLILETDFELDGGTVRIVDFMPVRDGGPPRLVRIVEPLSGEVDMEADFSPRLEYGSLAPWVEQAGDGVLALGGPDALQLATTLDLEVSDARASARFTVKQGARQAFVLTWFPSHEEPPPSQDPDEALAATEAFWTEWSNGSTYKGEWGEQVQRSLITLKALTDHATGAIVAAPTTSLPEELGGSRNWDYRYCWLRDSVLTLDALLQSGYTEEALRFGRWALRAWAGDPSKVQIMYGTEGQRNLDERELDWLPGYEHSRPVRIGNAAAGQFQLDVYGEVAAVAYATTLVTGKVDGRDWPRVRAVIERLETVWQQPDDGIWEVRGPRRHFVQSKVMAWSAFDTSIRVAEMFHLDAPLDSWRHARDAIHEEVLERGFDATRKTFTQYYGSKELDASLLVIPIVGFLPGEDPKVTGTIDAIRSELADDGFISRYSTAGTDDGLKGTEGKFLACSFWLVTALAMNGRVDDARALFDRLLALANDLGLYSEEYDVPNRRQIGNFPQAFTHLTLVEAAKTLTLAATGALAGGAAVRYTDSRPVATSGAA